MKTIWKFPIKVVESQTIAMPEGAAIVCIDIQNDTPCMWAIVDDSKQSLTRTFEIYGTGQQIPEDTDLEARIYAGTFQLSPLVWHL